MSPVPSELKDWAQVAAHCATAAGFITVTVTLMLNWRNYVQLSKHNSLEFQFKLWDLLRSKPPGQQDICEIIDAEEWSKLSDIPARERRHKLFLFEQIALLVNSKYMHPHLAHYMFGYHAIRCWDRKEFWPDLPDKTTGYWKLLQEFIEQMKSVEGQPWEKRRKKF
jgi:hypothetical protein